MKLKKVYNKSMIFQAVSSILIGSIDFYFSNSIIIQILALIYLALIYFFTYQRSMKNIRRVVVKMDVKEGYISMFNLDDDLIFYSDKIELKFLDEDRIFDGNSGDSSLVTKISFMENGDKLYFTIEGYYVESLNNASLNTTFLNVFNNNSILINETVY
jgi:hypothetical protein